MSMKPKYYRIAALQFPSMEVSSQDFAGEYKDAVEFARNFFRKTSRPTAVYSGNESIGHWWHTIRQDGSFLDRNPSGEFPAIGFVSGMATAYRGS